MSKHQYRCLAVIDDLRDAADGEHRIIRKEWYTGKADFLIYVNNTAFRILGRRCFAIRTLDSGDIKIWRLR